MDIYEVHRWLDLCEHEDPKIRAKAQAIIDAWEKDIQPDQMWRMKGQDNAICLILSVDKKIRVEVDAYNDEKGPSKKIAYFGKKSFLEKWERMF